MNPSGSRQKFTPMVTLTATLKISPPEIAIKPLILLVGAQGLEPWTH